MVVEQLIFTVIAFLLFVIMFYQMIKYNDTSYVVIFILQAIGIALNFFEVLFGIQITPFFVILKYVFAILIPVIIIIMDKKHIPLIEVFNVTKARIWMKFHVNKRAKDNLIDLLDKYPDNYKAHKLLAQIYEQEGGMRKAIDEYVQAIDANKQDYDSYYKVAELLNQLEKPDEASEMLFRLLSKNPEYEQATVLLGDILMKKEMYKEAVNVYQDALKYNPLSYDFNYSLGMAYTMLNDFQNAKICYEKAAEINSLSYNSKYSLAEIALIYKEIEEAEKYFMEVVDTEDLAADAYYELAKISLMKGNKDMAIKYANTAIDLDSKKIVPKIKKDPIFIPVIARIPIPFNLEGNKKAGNLTEIELKTKEHLEEMFEITRHLSYQDIEMLNYQMRKKEHDEKENIDREKEE